MTPIALTLQMADGAAEILTFRGIPVRCWQEAAKAYDAKDELTLISLSCDRPPKWAFGLAPDSVAEAAAAMQQVNRAFFEWLGRRQMMGMNPADMLKLQMELQSFIATTSPPASTQPASPSLPDSAQPKL